MIKIGRNLIGIVCVLVSLSSCKSSATQESNPDNIAVNFTKSFFSQIANSRNNDYSKEPTNGKKDVASDILSPFIKGSCTKAVIVKLADFYEGSIPPALQHDDRFYKNDAYEIKSKFNEGSVLEYKVAAINLSKVVVGSDKAFVGLTVVVDTTGKQPTVSDYTYGFVNIPNPGPGKN